MRRRGDIFPLVPFVAGYKTLFVSFLSCSWGGEMSEMKKPQDINYPGVLYLAEA